MREVDCIEPLNWPTKLGESTSDTLVPGRLAIKTAIMQMREVFLLFDRTTGFSLEEMFKKKNASAVVDRTQLITLFLEDERPTLEQLDAVLAAHGIEKDELISGRRYAAELMLHQEPYFAMIQ